MKRVLIYIQLMVLVVGAVYADKLLIPMNASQKNHLKAYGIAYWVLSKDQEVEWLLN